jgi:hypothetical protein
VYTFVGNTSVRNEALEGKFKNHIRANWEGQKGKYNISVDLENGPITNYYVHDKNGRAKVKDGIGGSTVWVYTKDIKSTTAVPESVFLNIMNHEYGHATAWLKDRYDETNEDGRIVARIHKGYKDKLMGDGRRGVVDEQTIEDLLTESHSGREKIFEKPDKQKSFLKWLKSLFAD